MYEALVRLKKSKEAGGRKFPIIAMMMGLAASGGYYIAMAADEIYAMPSTITGSIGVIMLMPDVSVLMDRFGVKLKALKSGPNKDAGSPFRALMPAEEKYFQDELVKKFYDQFLEKVVANRSRKGHTREKIAPLADGSIYLGPTAKEKGLIDEVGTLEDAIEKAAEAAGIKGRKRVVMYQRPGSWRGTVFAETPVPQGQTINLFNLNVNLDKLFLSTPNFLYLWQPGL
jgi:protease-4